MRPSFVAVVSFSFADAKETLKKYTANPSRVVYGVGHEGMLPACHHPEVLARGRPDGFGEKFTQ